MSASSSLICFLIYQLFIFQLVDCHCSKEFMCGTLTLSFPFTKRSEPKCGLLLVDCESSKPPLIQIQPGGNWRMPFWNENMSVIYPMSKKNDCSVFNNISLPKNNPAISLSTYVPNVSLLKCNTSSSSENSDVLAGYTKFSHCEKEHGFSIYYNYSDGVFYDYVGKDYPSSCSIIQRQLRNQTLDSQNGEGMFRLLDEGALVYWNLNGSCKDCYLNKHRCIVHPDNYTCSREEDSKPYLIIGSVFAGATFILICLVIFIIWRWKKRNNRDPYLLSSDPSSSKADVESGVYFGASVYSYADLEKATDTFASSRELGEGGFGIVYHGKLEDGRDVAVKRLYEHNYKRMEHFINEIRILTNLAHPNLVSLYGCTSKLSRELLLVYEYVPNGTLADHIHGEKASASSLTWPIRMNIALQTANALAYLHKSDIIHRDVKTNNILLDHNFNVKVADFGLSRLFPNNVTHVSTAPQGTPGYVDPEYHECYQLTDKSDVYSFGVVLVELISSLPAVDVTRNRYEINLANFAMRKIQIKAVHELIDPTLDYESNPEVRRMMNSTAELAFCCLQHEKQMRPRMDEIVDALETIKNWNFETKSNVETNDEFDFQKALKTHPSPESDEAVLIKHMRVSTSPISITDPWISESSTSSWSRETF